MRNFFFSFVKKRWIGRVMGNGTFYWDRLTELRLYRGP